jgi:putative hydrolase of the HAD superfamily
MTIKAVVFDYGQVICFPPDPLVPEKLAALSGIPAETLAALDLQHRGNLMDRGTCNAQEYYRQLFSFAGMTPPSAEKLEEIAWTDLNAWKTLNNDTVVLMRDLKRAGYKTAILSNMPHDFLAWARKNVPVLAEVDAGIFSCEVGAIKPEEAMYDALLQALGCGYNEMAFFDDVEVNIAAAKALGIHGFVFKDPLTARADLKALDSGFAAL